MKYILTFFLFLLGVLLPSKKNTNDIKSFVGEVYYKTFKTHSLSINNLTNSIEKMDHPLLIGSIEKYQIENEILINTSYDFQDNKIKNLSNIQIKHIQKVYSLQPPDIRKMSEVEELFLKKPEFILRKDDSRIRELKATKDKKTILGMQCKKFTLESYNKYTDQHFITEYWIEENLKFDQFKYGNSFSKIFSKEGLILEKAVLFEPSRDTFSQTQAIKISFIESFSDELNIIDF